MKYQISLTRLAFFIIISVSIFCMGIFWNQLLETRENTSKVIMNVFKTDLAETSYLISKNIVADNILGNLSFLEKRVLSNEFLSGVFITSGNNIILSTFDNNTFTKHKNIRDIPRFNNYNSLIDNYAISTDLIYYDNNIPQKYSLVYVLNHDKIAEVISNNTPTLIWLFIILPICVLIPIMIILQRLVLTPLNNLRKYVYSPENKPDEFLIKEINYIRNTFIETFERLDTEKKFLYDITRIDTLSGVANRYYLEEKILEIIESAKRRNDNFALIFLDLDNFKAVNDSLGHDIGDDLLKSVAAILKKTLRTNDIVTRIGGDEFILVINEYDNTSRLIEILERIRHNLYDTISSSSYGCDVTASIGVAVFPDDGDTLITLMKHADIALYHSKENGKNKFSFYTDNMNTTIQNIITLNNDMRLALKTNAFELFYQAQIDVITNEVIGCEALIRWIDNDKGIIAPSTFIGLAEQNGFIVDLGFWIMLEAFKQQYKWESEGIHIKISINFSSKQILDENFLVLVNEALIKYPINPGNICIEITEYVFLHKTEKVHETFNILKKIGFNIALDDFGTGYSSLSYIKQFPIDIIKVDKSFVDDFDTQNGQIFLKTIIMMTKTLNKKIVYEGIETAAQLEFFKTYGSGVYQGWLHSKALPANDFVKLLSK